MMRGLPKSNSDSVADRDSEHGPRERFGDPQTLLIVSNALSINDIMDQSAVIWAFGHLASPGDTIKVLEVVQPGRIGCSPGFQLSESLWSVLIGGSHDRADFSTFLDKSGIESKRTIEYLEELVRKKTEMYAAIISNLELSNQKKGVKLEVNILAGESRKHIALDEALSLRPTWVILERQCKRDVRYLHEKLHCNLVVMTRNQHARFIKVLTRNGSSDYDDIEKRSSSTVQLVAPLEHPKRRSPPLSPGHSPYSSVFTIKDACSPGLSSMISSPHVSHLEIPSAPNLDNSEALCIRTNETEPELPPQRLEQSEGLHVTKAETKTEVSRITSFPGISSPQVLCSTCRYKTPVLRPPRRIRLDEISKATNGFNKDHFLTMCGPHMVYHGFLDDGQAVSAKRLEMEKDPLALDMFQNEINILHLAHHKNVVTLIGYCNEEGQMILIYEYICNNSLAWHLSPSNPGVLPWKTRRKIALNLARGLCYLHDECRSGSIVHGHLGPGEIILTHDYMALICNFSQAKLQPHAEDELEDNHTHSKALGTLERYLAPECTTTSTMTRKSDVYAFGVVLLKLITGGQTVDPLAVLGTIENSFMQGTGANLIVKACRMLVDPLLGSNYDIHELQCMLFTAWLCTKKEVGIRPNMSKVVSILGDRAMLDATVASSFVV